jgi:ribosomal-protein-alanine N-acetyltransferase
LGLRPDLCGKGLGAELMELAINEYKRRFPKLALELDVRSFNERAIKLYTRSGFTVTGRFTGQTPGGETEFLHMRYTGEYI